jgi:methylenetetrahydrofolate dehydrogenase (NADP+)/methenyltetrahydrofolate cyclohydrolase
LHLLPQRASQKKLLEVIQSLNRRSAVDGILVQLPLPRHIREPQIIAAIDPAKDVDCFHPQNVGRLVLGEAHENCFWPCTPAGVQQILVRSGIRIEGKHVVVVGRSNIVGKPVALILMQKALHADATVTVCHSRTPNLAAHTRQADILIAAMGRPEVIKGHMLKRGAVVVDVGINQVADPKNKKGYHLVGDVHFASARKVASAITPVPGGVGPMTIAMLLHNTVLACKLRRA